MSKKKLSICIVAVLLLGLLLPGCGGGEQTGPAADEKVIKVGVIGPFTGPAARVGDEFKGAIQMAFEEIGYTVGDDYKVEFVWIDSESDAEKAARAYEQAILRDKITIGFNTWHAWVSAACMDIAAKYKIPHFLSFGSTGTIIEKYKSDPERYKYWVGKTWPLADKLSIGYVKCIEEAIEKGLWTPKNKNVAVYGVDNDWGRDFGNAVARQFAEAGWNVVATEWVALGETEFYPLLTKLQQLEASVVVGSMSDPPSVSAFIKQSREVGLKSLIISDGLGWVGEWYDLTGDASNFVLDQIPQWTTEEAKKFRDEFTRRNGFEPGASTAGLIYDTARFLIKIMNETIEEYGEPTTENFAKIIDKIIAGELTFTDGVMMKEWKYTPETFPDPVVGEDYYMFPVVQYMNGEAKVVWPEAWKDMDLQIPEWLQ